MRRRVSFRVESISLRCVEREENFFSKLVPGRGSLVPGSDRFQLTNFMGYS